MAKIAPLKIVFINGPPRSGKDTLMKGLLKSFINTGLPDSHQLRMSQPLKDAFQGFFDLNDAQFAAFMSSKDAKYATLFHKTFRDVQISLSEQWAKEVFGKDVLGHLMVRKLRQIQLRARRDTIVYISDSGFEAECIPILEEFGLKNCLLLRIYRPGTSYAADSRSYIGIDGLTTVTLHNSTTIHGFVNMGGSQIRNWLDSPPTPEEKEEVTE